MVSVVRGVLSLPCGCEVYELGGLWTCGVRAAGVVGRSYSHRVSCQCLAELCNASVLKGMKSGGSFILVV